MLRVGAAAAAILVVALPAAGDTPAERAASRESLPAAGEIPPIPGDPGDLADQAFLTQRTTGEVSKAKVSFTFPDVYMRAYLNVCFGDVGQDGYFGSDFVQRECSKITPLPLPSPYRDSTAGIAGGTADVYFVTSHRGRNARNTYGSLPAVKVRSLVFGSIPVSATVQLSQTVTNGYLDPIKAVNGNVLALTADQPVYPGFPDAPNSIDKLTFKNSLDATLQLRVSDVAVDGRPVEVGSRCGTVSPVRLSVRQPLGYWDENDPADRKRGLPGGFVPLEQSAGLAPGYFDGNVDVPAFSNCGSATEDLDPLLTALVSSPTNHVSAFLPVGISLMTLCDSPIADDTCTPGLAAAQRRMSALAAAIQHGKSPADIRKLQAKLKPSDYVFPKVKANGDR